MGCSASLRGHGSAARTGVVGRGDHEQEGPPGTNMLSPTQLLYKTQEEGIKVIQSEIVLEFKSRF